MGRLSPGCHIEPNGVRILTRGGHDWTHRFSAIEQAARALGPATMIIDGEAVVLDDKGRPDFGPTPEVVGCFWKDLRQTRLWMRFLYAFDLLYLDGHDIREMEYRSRRHLLEDTLKGCDGAIRVSETVEAEPDVLLEHVRSLGLEGIVGKNSISPIAPAEPATG